MSNLNKDVLYLILKRLRDDRKSLYSCLSVNKTWCEIIIPILWKDPWEYLKVDKETILYDVIVSHLSNETKENLKSQGINLLSRVRQRPLFNYISFCRYLVLYRLEEIIFNIKNIEYSKVPIMRNEIFKLFINGNTRFTHLYIPLQFNYPIHLIPGAENCFSELNFLQCSFNTNQSILEGLTRITKSIKGLELVVVASNNNRGIVKLVEAQKNLNDVRFVCYTNTRDESFCKTFEESLIKHADTIQNLKIDREPITRFLSYLVNLSSLELIPFRNTNWSHLENVSLPVLRILKAQKVPSKILSCLIKNTKGHLSEISAQYTTYDEEDDKLFIQSIYENCLDLKYLKLSIKNDDLSEFEKLLIICQYLDGLIVNSAYTGYLNWEKLFEILTRSAPDNLFKFKFDFELDVELRTFKTFFDNWKDRRPMSLKIFYRKMLNQDYINLINGYKEEGIIKTFINNTASNEFIWINK